MSDSFTVFAIPSYTHTCSVEFAHSLAAMSSLLTHRDMAHAIFFVGGICFVDQVRNVAVQKFLTGIEGMQREATDLFFLDDDVGFPAQAVLDLIERPEEIVFGAYPKKDDAGTFPVSLKLDEQDRTIWNDGLVLADGAPGGFLRIKRKVLETLAAQAQRYMYTDANQETVMIPHIFECGPRNGMYWGEDVGFSAKAQGAGFDLWCKPDIQFSHRGSKLWKGMLSDKLKGV